MCVKLCLFCERVCGNDNNELAMNTDVPSKLKDAFERARGKPNWAGVIEVQTTDAGKDIYKGLLLSKGKNGKIVSRRNFLIKP